MKEPVTGVAFVGLQRTAVLHLSLVHHQVVTTAGGREAL